MDVLKIVDKTSLVCMKLLKTDYGIKLTNSDFFSLRCYLRFFYMSKPDLIWPDEEALHLFLLHRFGIDNVDLGCYVASFGKGTPIHYYRPNIRKQHDVIGMGIIDTEQFKTYCRRHADEWRGGTTIPLEHFAERT